MPAGRITAKNFLCGGRYKSLWQYAFRGRTGQIHIWELVRSNREKKIACVFAVTKEKEVVLIKIYRPAIDEYIIELPGGISDFEGESHENIARRELLEETGYWAEEIVPIIGGYFSPASSDTRVALVFAKDCEWKQSPNLEETEDIEVIIVPLKDLVDFALNPPENVKVNPGILTPLPVLEKKGLI